MAIIAPRNSKLIFVGLDVFLRGADVVEHACRKVCFEEMREVQEMGEVLRGYDVAEEVDAEALWLRVLGLRFERA